MITPYPINNNDNNNNKRKGAKELKRKGSREMGRIKERNKRRRKTQHIFSNASISTYEKVYNSLSFHQKKNHHQNVPSSFLFSSFCSSPSSSSYSFSYSPSSALFFRFLFFSLLKNLTNTVALVIGPKCSATLSFKHTNYLQSQFIDFVNEFRRKKKLFVRVFKMIILIENQFQRTPH